MRRFLTAFFCLSTLAMAQNVIAASPASTSPQTDGLAIIECPVTTTTGVAPDTGLPDAEDLVLIAAVPERRGAPEPGTMVLLVAGLSGLTAVGARGNDRIDTV